MSLVDDIGHVLAPPHPAGRPFILGGLIAVMLGLLLGAWLAWLGLLFTLFCLFFFRDPERVPPRPRRRCSSRRPTDAWSRSRRRCRRPNSASAPAPRWRVAIFLSRDQRARQPRAGRRHHHPIAYRHGASSAPAWTRPASATSATRVAIRLADGREIAFVQIAGLIARRIVCDGARGRRGARRQRFGIIRFGSRTDLYLPESVRPLVAVGRTMIGGETVIAELPA